MKKSILLFILLCFFLLPADTLQQKQAELDDLNKKLAEMDDLIEQTQSQKAQKEALKKEMQQKKADLEKSISDLEINQNKAQLEWDKTKEKLQLTTQNLDLKKQSEQQLYDSAHELGNALLASHYSRLLYHNADAWIIATSLLAASDELKNINADISNLQNTRQSLAKKEKKDEKYFKDVQWSKIVSKKKKSAYESELVVLDKEVSSLDREYQQALARKQELEDARSEMNDLIIDLQKKIAPYKPAYSYQFSSTRLIWPLQGRLIRAFGDYQGDTKRLTLHNDGIDIAADIGSEVKCVDKGVVVFCSRRGGSGRVVIIDHQNGYYTIYAHNDELLVSLGDSVQKGTVLAKSGMSGLVDEPCLHFEIRRDGKAINPLEYLEF